jgi:hypothetical protein
MQLYLYIKNKSFITFFRKYWLRIIIQKCHKKIFIILNKFSKKIYKSCSFDFDLKFLQYTLNFKFRVILIVFIFLHLIIHVFVILLIVMV